MNVNPPSSLLPWPLVVVIEDCFVPEQAEEVLKVAESANPDLIGAVIACWAYNAQQQLASRQN